MSISFLHVPTFSSSRVICILYVSFTFCRLVTKAPMLHVLQGVQNVSIEGQLLPGFVAALRPRTWNGNTRHRTRTLVRQRSILGRHLKGRIVDACLRSARFRICRLGAQGRAAAPFSAGLYDATPVFADGLSKDPPTLRSRLASRQRGFSLMSRGPHLVKQHPLS